MIHIFHSKDDVTQLAICIRQYLKHEDIQIHQNNIKRLSHCLFEHVIDTLKALESPTVKIIIVQKNAGISPI